MGSDYHFSNYWVNRGGAMSDMKCSIKCPIYGEILQKYGEINPDAGTSIVLGANCSKCGIGNSDIKLWQELIRTRRALETGNKDLSDKIGKLETELDRTRKALETIRKEMSNEYMPDYAVIHDALKTALEQKE